MSILVDVKINIRYCFLRASRARSSLGTCHTMPDFPSNYTHMHVATAQQLADKFLPIVDKCEETN